LTGVLREHAQADNSASALRSIIDLGDELSDYNFPYEFMVGVVGDSGVGM
jgi:hypothetical protein